MYLSQHLREIFEVIMIHMHYKYTVTTINLVGTFEYVYLFLLIPAGHALHMRVKREH